MNNRSYIAGGHVFCRVQQRDIDIEQCFGCMRLRTLGDEASPPFIECDTRDITPSLEEQRAHAQWRIQHHQRT